MMFFTQIMNAQIKTDRVIQIVGPSGSGKTMFVCQLFSNPDIFESKIHNIYWLQGAEDGESGHTQDIIKQLSHVNFVNGFADGWEELAKSGDALVIDDLFQESTKEKNFVNLFTKIARHRHVLVIFITQNLFHQGGNHRTRNLNVHYLAIFKNPRDKTVIDYLSRQVYPQNRNFLMDVFEDVTQDSPHSYLFMDFTQDCPDEIRVRSDLFNPRGITVHVQQEVNKIAPPIQTGLGMDTSGSSIKARCIYCPRLRDIKIRSKCSTCQKQFRFGFVISPTCGNTRFISPLSPSPNHASPTSI